MSPTFHDTETTEVLTFGDNVGVTEGKTVTEGTSADLGAVNVVQTEGWELLQHLFGDAEVVGECLRAISP